MSASAPQVRAFFRSNDGAFNALSEKAQATVRAQDESMSVRGRLSPEAITAFNKANPRGKYVLGAPQPKTVTVKAVKTSAKGKVSRVAREVSVPEAREALALAGVETGARGRLSSEQVELVGAATFV